MGLTDVTPRQRECIHWICNITDQRFTGTNKFQASLFISRWLPQAHKQAGIYREIRELNQLLDWGDK